MYSGVPVGLMAFKINDERIHVGSTLPLCAFAQFLTLYHTLKKFKAIQFGYQQ